MKKNIILILLTAICFAACDDVFEPALENHLQRERMYNDANFALEFLSKGYGRLPDFWAYSFSEIATDDAVSNVKTDFFTKMATGQWRADHSAFEEWGNSFTAIQYLNILLEESDKVQWTIDPITRQLFNDRIRGEAYALRGLHLALLLKAHAGWTEAGELKGVPVLTHSLDAATSEFNLPRDSYETCMQQIYKDYAKAEELLPLDYHAITSESEIPAKYAGMEGINIEIYNRVFGDAPRKQYRISARIVKAFRAQAALFAASPAYDTGGDARNTTTWANVADYAAEVLDLNDGLNKLSNAGWKWYDQRSEVNNLAEGDNPAEILWRRRGVIDANDWERSNYPPSLYGEGRINPTQNLVDAFPMKNGYPIEDKTKSGYDAEDPYYNRDPRLAQYIIYNGNAAGPANKKIWTDLEDPDNVDALNVTERSTRTGYYMHKLLRHDVNLSPTSTNTQKHLMPKIRYTEIFLIYAEAANRAYGPDGTGTHAYSARDVMKAIRKRAGVGGTNDPYLMSISDPNEMDKLIRNERRIELCFEGFRFWDLRRWKENLTDPARGIRIKDYEYTPIEVENRNYKDYMYYGPIPYGEMLKWSNLEQNKGWQ